MKHILQKFFLFFITIFPSLAFTQGTCNNQVTWTTNNYNGLTANSSTTLFVDDFSNKNRLTDTNLTNSASWSPLVLGSAWIEVKNNTPQPAGVYVGVVLSDFSLLDLSSTYTLETYMGNNKTSDNIQISFPVNIATSTNRNIGLISTQPFDRIRLSIGALGVVSYDVNYFYTITPCPTPTGLDCNKSTAITQDKFPAVINYKNGNTGLSGLSVGSINDLENIVNKKTDDFGTISLGIAVNASAKVAVKDLTTTFIGGSFAGFDIENSNLLDIGLLNGTKIQTYLKGVLQETSTDNSILLKLSLLGGSNRGEIGFVTTKDFDEVQLVQTNLLGLDIFGSTKIYNMVVKKVCEGLDLVCNVDTKLRYSNYPVSIGANTGTTGLLTLGSVSNANNILDDIDTNYASMNILAGALSTATLAIKKALSPFPANSYVSFEIENSSLINLSVLSNYGIRLLKNGTQVGIAQGTNLLVGANILGSNKQTIGFLAPAEFDEVQLTINNTGLSVNLGVTKVYSVNIKKPCSIPLNCDEEYELNSDKFPVVINALRTGPTSIACVGCSVTNPENLISSNTTDFATLNIPVGILSGVSVSVEDLATIYPKGTKVAFTINDTPGILQLDLLESIRITTYLNGVQQEIASSTELLDLSLIFNIVGSGTKSYGFQTTKPFDEVQLTAFSVANLLNSLNVYNLKIDTKNSDGEGIVCIGNPYAEDDIISLFPGETSTIKVTDNDTSNGQQAGIGSNVTITQISTSNPGVNINSEGKITVDNTVTPGQYQLTYRICNISDPTQCDEAIVQVNVKQLNDIDGDGIPDDQDLDNDNDGILDTNECFSLTHVSGNFPTSGGNVNTTSNGWLIDGTYASNGSWASPTGRVNFGVNGLTFQRDLSTTSIFKREMNTANLNGAKITFDNMKWLHTLSNSGVTPPENTNSDKSFILNVYVRGVKYMTINSGNENSPTIVTHNGAKVNFNNLASYPGGLPTTENHGIWSPATNLIMTLPISGVPDNNFTDNEFKLEFIASPSPTRVRDLAMTSITIESCRDLDNDGLQDYLDNDSDGDGCPDAIEGGDNITANLLKANGQINSAVDANGVPVFVNPGSQYDVDNLQGQSINNNKPYNPNDTSECPTFCVKPGNKEVGATPTSNGISTLSKQLPTWPSNIPNGFIALESKEKGFVITTVNGTNNIAEPKLGMIVYDDSPGAKCIKLYSLSGPNNEAQWKCIERTCNE